MRSAVESSKSDSSCILFYNPYSIVKELPIAKTGAELRRFPTALTADSRGLFCGVAMGNLMEMKAIPAQLLRRGCAWWS